MELKETQEELLQMERLSTLGKFSSLILHDIRNPLSILKGYAELIQMRADDTERVKKCSVKIIGEANRLNRIASELLDYSRGEIRLNMQIVNLKDFVDSVLEAIKDRYVAQQINVVTEITYTGPVLMDNERMHRVLFNLADNARKAMPNGGKLFIKIVEEKENYTITIRDTGVGMTSEVKNRIFEPFFSYSKKGGTGLGMSIVQSIVDAHNGSLKVESKVNVGTKFSIMMPKYS